MVPDPSDPFFSSPPEFMFCFLLGKTKRQKVQLFFVLGQSTRSEASIGKPAIWFLAFEVWFPWLPTTREMESLNIFCLYIYIHVLFFLKKTHLAGARLGGGLFWRPPRNSHLFGPNLQTCSAKNFGIWAPGSTATRSPSERVPFLTVSFLGEGVPTKIDCRKKKGYPYSKLSKGYIQ